MNGYQWKDGKWVERQSIWQEAVIGLGWLTGFVCNRVANPLYGFMVKWVESPDTRHSRAAAIGLFLIMFLLWNCIHN